MKLLIVTLFLILTSCAYKTKTDIKPNFVYENQTLDTTKIKFNGYYNILDTVLIKDVRRGDYGKRNCDIYKTINLKVFGKTKNIFNSYRDTKDNSAFSCEFYKEEFERYKLYNIDYEKFIIKNDSIYTYSLQLITVGAGQRVPVYCNYRGFVKNRDTIIDWKVIPPYPKDFTKFVIEKNKDLFEPKTLYFVKTDAVNCLKIDEFK